MKHLLLLIILLGSFSCQSFSKWMGRSPSAETPRSAKHFIFTVHGLAGDATTFGDMLPVLKNHLEYVDPKYEVVTQTFMYSTGRMDADVPQFIESFEKFLVDYFKSNPLGKNDKISIVSHSQGGLVTTLWYAKTIAGTDQRQIEIADKVKTIVTLGTPFWGSGMAHIINDKLPFEWMQNLVYKIMAVGKLEVRDMSLASNKIFDFFRAKAMSKYEQLNSPYMLNISGVAPNTSKSRRLNVGDRWESDKVVHVPSTRLGFYFYSDSITQYVTEKVSPTVELKDFNYSQYFSHEPEFKLIETTHTTMGDTLGMAVIPYKCVDAAQCDQPTYAPVFTHLSRCEAQENSCDQQHYKFMRERLYKNDESFGSTTQTVLMNQMRTFQLSFNLQLPKDFVPPKDLFKTKGIAKYIKVNYKHGPKESKNRDAGDDEDALVNREFPFQDFRIQLGRYKEWGSRVAKHFQDTNQVNVQLTGNVKPTDAYWNQTRINPGDWSAKSFPVTVTVDIPGLKPRTVTMPLRPTYTTFVELNLEK